MKASPDPNVTLISQNAVEVVRGLRSEAGKDIWLLWGRRPCRHALQGELD
jgi:hypothetical protein